MAEINNKHLEITGNSMSAIHQQPTELALWYSLVEDAKSRCDSPLATDESAYLVYLLMRYLQKPEITENCFALSYLEAQLETGRYKADRLQAVGDQCLLTSGFFPQQAHRKRVRLNYFVQLGQAAYLQLAESSIQSIACLYSGLAEQFVRMMDVLQTLKGLSAAEPLLTPLDAIDLWQQTGSDRALQALELNTDNFLIQGIKTRQ